MAKTTAEKKLEFLPEVKVLLHALKQATNRMAGIWVSSAKAKKVEKQSGIFFKLASEQCIAKIADLLKDNKFNKAGIAMKNAEIFEGMSAFFKENPLPNISQKGQLDTLYNYENFLSDALESLSK